MKNPYQNLVLIALISIFILSCSKKDNREPVIVTPPPVILPDTLSGGWTKTVLKGAGNIVDVAFSNAETGYLAASGKFYKTVNGGISWDSLSATTFGNLSITSNGNIFGTTAYNGIQKSTNGGQSFINVSTVHSTSDVFFTCNDTGYAVSINGTIYRSTNQGTSWETLTNLTAVSNNYASVFFTDDQHGLASNGSDLFKTNGDSRTWKKCNINTGDYDFSIFAVTSNIVYVGGYSGNLLKSTDGGENFNLVKKFEGQGYMDVHFINQNIGFVAHESRIYKTTNGGNSWQTVVALGNDKIIEIFFTDASHGWACGEKGLVLRFRG